MRLYVYSSELILAAMHLRKVGIDGRSFVVAPTQVSTVVTPPAPAAQNLGVSLRRTCSADLQRSRVHISDFIYTLENYISQRWRGPQLRLRQNTSAWASWLPHWCA
jgi:hypothetical protein